MFELALVYANLAERERVVAADLRRRQLLKSPAEAIESDRARTASPPTPRTEGTRVHAVGR